MNSFIRKKVQEEKRRFEALEAGLAASYRFPDDVEELRDIPYPDTPADGADWRRMDIYRPRGVPGPLPVLLDIHGGGLMMARKESNRAFCAAMAQMGFLVFCAEYPLVPEVLVYQQFAAISAAMDAVDALLAEYGGDRDRVYLAGDSAGAYLVTYAAAMQGSEKLSAAAGVKPSRLPVRALGLLSGMFYTRRVDASGIFVLTGTYYGGGWRKHPFRPYMDPEHREVTGHLPPCFLLTAKGDYLRHYTLAYHRALGAAGVDCELLDIQDSDRLTHVFSVLYPAWEESRRANRALADFLLRH